MTVACESCGAPLDSLPKFCPECGAKVGAAAGTPAREARKVVTILFADIAGSTALGEQLDPETVRSALARYFAVMKRVIESHGGVVEKFAGDAVMAVFGIPALHEDDALRAVRAAAEIRTRLADLEAELAPNLDVAIRFRTGINTGEVVTSASQDGQPLVTGDAVNTAARLEQVAAPAEILLGRLTWQLVRDAVDAERIDALALRGKAQPVEAYRLTGVRPGVAGHERRLDTPLVGRHRELARLEQALRGAVDNRACHLVTLLGSAGIGKSRLVGEFAAAAAGEARILRGRCLPYGDGATYWPIGEIVRGAAGIGDAESVAEARTKLRGVLAAEREGERVASAIEGAIGLTGQVAPPEDLFWATRRFLEHLAAEEPVVAVIEDIHWAESTLLDLIEHIADWSRDAPLVLLCPARPELLDLRTGWGGGKLNATTLLLEPLGGGVTAGLIRALPGGAALPGAVVDRIAAAAEGNPLFVEEMVAVLRDDGLLIDVDGKWQATARLADVRVPASIAALLAARLEQLPAGERSVAELASVVGRVFEHAAVASLASEGLEHEVRPGLEALVRKDLVRPERLHGIAGDAFKFRHILIRDAAYERLPKAERATLHERFADWLERTAGDRITEYEEILGHHLGAAHGYLVELGERGVRVDRLAVRACERFAAAGRRARDRGEAEAGVRLLGAAAALSPLSTIEGRAIRVDLARVTAAAGNLPEAGDLAAEVREAASAAGDSLSEVRARVIQLDLLNMGGQLAPDNGGVDAELQALRELAQGHGDQHALVELWIAESYALWNLGRIDEANEASRRAAAAAEQLGMRAEVEELQLGVAWGLLHGSTHVDAVAVYLNTLLESTSSSLVRAKALSLMAVADAMRDEFEGARKRVSEFRGILIDHGQRFPLAETAPHVAWVERLARDHEAELRRLDEWQTYRRDAGAAVIDGLPSARRAHALAKLGRIDEAMAEVASAEADTFPIVRMLCHLVRARQLVEVGRHREALIETDRAEAAAREVSTSVNSRTEALIDIAWTAVRADDRAKARSAAGEALDMAEAKGNVPLARLARLRLQEAAD